MATIDDSGASPVLAKFVLVATNGTGGSTDIPALTNGFIWFNQVSTEGFPPDTGTGSTTSSINWGNLDRTPRPRAPAT